ncbi:hypothetical protein GFGA_2c0063 (plasmid) [Gluconobacter frateurii NBRC 103465]|nr:hypothetical protein GFGA_2c0063 [Gluconobacter frateurii NBRC 103465]
MSGPRLLQGRTRPRISRRPPPPCSGRSGPDGLSRRPSWPVAGWAQENATSLPLSSPSVCSPHGQDGSRKTSNILSVINK